MSHPTPRRILLATDLGARSDRALDRAVALAREWGAELVVAHVINPMPEMFDDDRRRPSWQEQKDPAELAMARLRRDLGHLDHEMRMVLMQGETASEIAAIASREQCDLIITGVARDETLGRMFLGGTVERLLRTSPAPVLVVKRRATRSYEDILVAVDFSEASLAAFRRAAALFPEAALTALHGYDAPFLLDNDPEELNDYLRKAEEKQAAVLIEKAGAGIQERSQVLIEYGNPVRLVEAYIQSHDPGLLVVGNHGRSALYELMIGSVAKALIQTIDTDILLVRGEEKA